jgi:hypothetical protein
VAPVPIAYNRSLEEERLPTLDRKDLVRLARAGAEARLATLQAEMTAILELFPDLRRAARVGRSARSRRSAAAPQPPRARRQRRWTAAQRKAAAERMRKYWSAKKGAGKK